MCGASESTHKTKLLKNDIRPIHCNYFKRLGREIHNVEGPIFTSGSLGPDR